MPLDPDYARLAAPFEAYDADWVNGSPDVLRGAYATARAALDGDVHPDCTITPFPATAPLNGLSFRPRGMAAHGETEIVFFHGGSWVVGSPETHQVICSHLAAETGLTVRSVDYGLAPEHPYPSQREDGVRAVGAAFEGAFGEAGATAPRRLLLAGDSAGAALCFWVDAVLDAADRARIDGILAIYGAYGAPRDAAGEPGSGLSSAELDAARARLGPPDTLAADPVFHILSSVRTDGPPCYLSAADCDPLLGDSEALYAHLKASGRDVTLDIAPGLPHGHLHYVARVPAVRAAFDRAVGWVGRATR